MIEFRVSIYPQTKNLTVGKENKYKRRFAGVLSSILGKNGYEDFRVYYSKNRWYIVFLIKNISKDVYKYIWTLEKRNYFVDYYEYKEV